MDPKEQEGGIRSFSKLHLRTTICSLAGEGWAGRTAGPPCCSQHIPATKYVARAAEQHQMLH